MLGKELISLAKRRGTKLINVVRRDEAANELKQLGCACCDCWIVSGDTLQPCSLCFNMAWMLCSQWSAEPELVYSLLLSKVCIPRFGCCATPCAAHLV